MRRYRAVTESFKVSRTSDDRDRDRGHDHDRVSHLSSAHDS